jgi:uncharacterized protein
MTLDPGDTMRSMGTTYSIRDLGILPGQSKHEELQVDLVPYVQGGVDYVDAGGKAPVLAPKQPTAPVIEYVVAGGEVPARLDVTEMSEGTSFRLRFEATYDGPCARCLEPAHFTAHVDSHMVHDETAAEDEDELRSVHVDDRLHVLDVSSWAREEVGVQFPTRLLCRPDCRGLCPQCGVDLNEHPEHEHEQPTDSRWDALRQLQVEPADD